MVQYARRFAERQANMFVVAATTPAQLFHALRRQMNRPFVKPLVLMTPKCAFWCLLACSCPRGCLRMGFKVCACGRYLLHHTPATSALRDFAVGTFFNRVIDDGKVRRWCYCASCTPGAASCLVWSVEGLPLAIDANGSMDLVPVSLTNF